MWLSDRSPPVISDRVPGTALTWREPPWWPERYAARCSRTSPEGVPNESRTRLRASGISLFQHFTCPPCSRSISDLGNESVGGRKKMSKQLTQSSLAKHRPPPHPSLPLPLKEFSRQECRKITCSQIVHSLFTFTPLFLPRPCSSRTGQRNARERVRPRHWKNTHARTPLLVNKHTGNSHPLATVSLTSSVSSHFTQVAESNVNKQKIAQIDSTF